MNPAEPVGISIGAAVDADLAQNTAAVGGKTYQVFNITKTAAGKATGRATPAEPCCAITAIDATSRLLTAKNTATGQTFQFRLNAAEPISGFKIGQAVSADLSAKTATVVEPCCAIQSINAKSGVLTLVDTSSGKAFQVKVANPALVGQLQVGQQLFATAARDAFSVDGLAPCCGAVIL